MNRKDKRFLPSFKFGFFKCFTLCFKRRASVGRKEGRKEGRRAFLIFFFLDPSIHVLKLLLLLLVLGANIHSCAQIIIIIIIILIIIIIIISVLFSQQLTSTLRNS